MKALITGSAGFVGRHMMRELVRREWNVTTCDINDELADWRDAHHLFRSLHDERYDLVVHAAAVAPHRAAIDGQPSAFVMNMHLDAAMFEWAIETRQRRVLYLSSSAAYPVDLQNIDSIDAQLQRLQEDEIDLDYPELADGRYGFGKLAGEHLARATREHGVPVTVVRPFSGYGEDQGTNWPFGAFVQRVYDNVDPFVIWGSAEQRRDWIHISDVVNGALAVIESETDEPVNLCTGQATAMGDLAHLMMQTYTGSAWNIEVDASKPLGVMNRVGDPTRFFQYYEPRVTIEEGVRRAFGKAMYV